MDGFNFSKAFLDFAFITLVESECESEHDKQVFGILCELCNKHDISIRALARFASEFDQRMKEFNDENTV